MKDKKLAMRITLIILAVLVIVIGGVYAAMTWYYSSHFFSGSVVNGFDVAGLTVDEVKKLIRDEIGTYSLTVYEKDDKSEVITAEDIKLEYVDDNKVDELMVEQEAIKWPLSFARDKAYEMTANTTYSKEALATRIQSMDCLNPENVVAPSDAYLQEDTANMSFSIVPEVVGNTLDQEKMTVAITEALDAGSTEVDLREPDCYIYPTVYSDDETLNNKLNQWTIFLNTNLTYRFGNNTEVVDKTVIYPMLTDEGDQVTLSDQAVADLVYQWASKYDTFGLPRQFKTHAGNTITVEGGDYGWVINKDKTKEAVAAAIMAGETGEKEPVFRYSAKSWDNSDLGGTYVEVSIAEQRMWCYKDYQVIVDTPVVTGMPTAERMTHTGCFAIDAKKSPSVLKGEGYASEVTYWMPFNGNEGIHDADRWRSQYGGVIYQTNGSHGCVNTPADNARIIYETVEIGTAVVVY